MPRLLAAITVALLLTSCNRNSPSGVQAKDSPAEIQSLLDKMHAAIGKRDFALAESYTITLLNRTLTDAQRATVWHTRATVNFQNDAYDAAVSAVTEAIRFEPDELRHLEFRAMIRATKADHGRFVNARQLWEEVARDAEEIVTRAPDNARGWAMLAEAHSHQGKSKDAEREFRKAIQLDPGRLADARRVMPDTFPR